MQTWPQPGQLSEQLGGHRGPGSGQKHCQEAAVTSQWSVTTKKCHTAGC